MKLLDDITKKNPFGILIVLVILGCIISNRLTVSSLQKSAPVQPKKSKKNLAALPGPSVVNKVTVSDSLEITQPVGMTIQDRYGLPQTQDEWDNVTQKMFNQKEIKGSAQTQEAFAGRNLTPVEYKQRLELLNQQIKDLEKKVQSEPMNSGLNQRLQNLYMLKSTLTNLREEVVR